MSGIERLTFSEVSESVVRWNVRGNVTLLSIDDAADLVGYIMDTYSDDPEAWRMRSMTRTVGEWRSARAVEVAL